MVIMSGLGIVLSLVFGCLLLALVAELYYLLWWKKQRIKRNSNNNSNRMEDDSSNHTKELFYLFCWDKPTSISNPNPNTIVGNPQAIHNNDPDVELGLNSSKDLLLKALGEDGVESDIMRLHNLACPPRFLFTIKEETKEDLESDDGRSRKGSRTRSLSDLIMALETQTPYRSPLASPPWNASPNLSNNNYNNPLFESSMEAEIYRLRSSPPPKFKFLRDAEEKLYRRLLIEVQKTGVLQVNISDNPIEDDNKDGCLMIKGKVVNGGKIKEREVHCTSQVLPLDSSPVENKGSLHH